MERGDVADHQRAQRAVYDLPDDYFTPFVPKGLALTEDAVTAVAAKHIDPDRLLTVIVGDRDKLAPSLKALELGDIADLAP